MLAQLAGIEWTQKPGIPSGSLYVETDAWLAETPNVPVERVKYPSLSQLLTIHSAEGHIVVADEFDGVVNYAKFRRFIADGHSFDIEPTASSVLYKRDGKLIAASDLPDAFRKIIERYDATLSSLLLH